MQHGQIDTLRLSQQLSRERVAKAKRYVDAYDPDWLSLQFVPHAFNAKGISLALPGQLKKIGGYRKSHIMFHELWIEQLKNQESYHGPFSFYKKGFVRLYAQAPTAH